MLQYIDASTMEFNRTQDFGAVAQKVTHYSQPSGADRMTYNHLQNCSLQQTSLYDTKTSIMFSRNIKHQQPPAQSRCNARRPCFPCLRLKVYCPLKS